jgi:hypothetical protein
VTLNVLVPCVSPPSGYEFKNWLNPPALKFVSSTNLLASYFETCNLDQSAKCIDYSSTNQQGWFKNSSNVCDNCFKIENFSTCNWKQFRDLTTCRDTTPSQCKPCRGLLPPNAAFTKAKFPFYFDETEQMPCEWDCNVGFFKQNNTCVACSKPINSNFEAGPYRSSLVKPEICLNPTTCKFFGGSPLLGCMYVCKVGYKLTNGSTCTLCPEKICQPGEIQYVNSDNCYDCKSCPNFVDDSVFVESCNFECNAGFYQKNNTYCEACQILNCSNDYYSGDCYGMQNSKCLKCSLCEPGTYLVNNCNVTHDTLCAPCNNELPIHSYYWNACNTTCLDGYVEQNSQCTICAKSDNDCMIGKRFTTNCTGENLGCQNCTVPDTFNWCWTGGSVCAWDCLKNYRKYRNKCVFDATKNFNPFCAAESVVLLTTTTPTTSSQLSTTTAITTTLKVFQNEIQFINLDLNECLCKSNEIQQELSTLLGIRVYVSGCQENALLIPCVNFQCQCANNMTKTRRRLLQTTTTTVYIVYDGQVQNNVTIFEYATQTVFQKKVRVLSLQSLELPLNNITWQQILFFPQSKTNSAELPIYAIVIIVVVILAILILVGIFGFGSIVTFNDSKSKSSNYQGVLNVKLNLN